MSKAMRGQDITLVRGNVTVLKARIGVTCSNSLVYLSKGAYWIEIVSSTVWQSHVVVLW